MFTCRTCKLLKCSRAKKAVYRDKNGSIVEVAGDYTVQISDYIPSNDAKSDSDRIQKLYDETNWMWKN